MKKIGISTVYTGYNYGSALQAYATKVILDKLGYKGEIISLKGSLIKGRDIRIKKLMVMGARILAHPIKMKKRASAYRSSVDVSYSNKTKELFDEFMNENNCPVKYTWNELKKIANTNEYTAFLCGSDQIWNGDTLYVDPQYYLRYAPQNKRISFAPSFGREKVADYNEKIVKKYISEIKHLSVREKSGVQIIKKLVGKDAVQLIDPTLMVSGKEWCEQFDLLNPVMASESKYILAYFLNNPSNEAKDFMRQFAQENNVKIISIPYVREKEAWFDCVEDAGPIEFLKLIKGAECVFTDSFHGTAFSINLHVPYYTFEREYGNAEKQSSRIESLLTLVNQRERFNPTKFTEINFANSDEVLENERKKANIYLENSILNVL